MIGGELVREARKRAGLTQRELAERAGTTQSAVARFESGRSKTALEDVIRYLRLTGFDLRVELVKEDPSDRMQVDLRSSPQERLVGLVRFVRMMEEFREAGRRAG